MSDRRRSYDRRDDRRRSWEEPQYSEAEDIQNRIRALLVRIGDDPSQPLEKNLDRLAESLDIDLEDHSDTVLNVLVNCAAKLPLKTPVYGTLTGLLNQKRFDFVARVVDATQAELRRCLEANDLLRSKLLVRFFGELVNANVVSASSLCNWFDQLLDTALDSNCAHGKADFCVFLFIASLPWCGKELSERSADDVTKLWDKADSYMAKRKSISKTTLAVFEDSDNSEDYLEEVWGQIKTLKAEGWETPAILKPYLAFDSQLSMTSQHSISETFDIPLQVSGDFFTNCIPFRIFDPIETGRDLPTCSRFVLESYVVDTLQLFTESHKECSKKLLNIPVPFAYDHILIESIFGQMFKLPSPTTKLAYYAVVLFDVCKAHPVLPPVLATAIEIIFDRLDTINIECMDRFCEWFAHHLSNFDFKWQWKIWEDILDLPEDSRKQFAIKEVLDKCTRLSYLDRVKRTVPEDFYPLLPEQKPTGFKYGAGSELPGATTARAILQNIRDKALGDEMQEFVTSQCEEELRMKLLSHCVLHAGSKSFSHVVSLIERYAKAMAAVGASPQAKAELINEVREYWMYSPQMTVILMDRLMTVKLLDNVSMIRWVFHEKTLPYLKRTYPWEILRNAVNKTIARTKTVYEDMERLEKVEDPANPDAHNNQLMKVKATLETYNREQKEMFLVLFQCFRDVLTTYLERCKSEGTDYRDYWYACVVSRMKQLGTVYYKEIAPFLATLESLLFAKDECDERIRETFVSFRTLQA